MIRQTCDSAIGIPGEDYRIAIRKWEVIKRKVTIHEQRLTLMSQGSGNLSKLYYWLNEAEALLESYENVQENDGITSLRCRMERHKVHPEINQLFEKCFASHVLHSPALPFVNFRIFSKFWTRNAMLLRTYSSVVRMVMWTSTKE